MTRTIAVLTALWLTASSAHAADSTLAVPASEAAARAPWTLSVGVGLHHDDNVLQLSQRNLDRLATTPGPPRFRIDSPGDQVLDLSASVGLRARLLPRRESRLVASASADQFTTDAVKSWQEYGISATQELTASRRMLSTVRLWAGRIPQFYLGEITDDDESFAAGRRIRHSLIYAQTALGARLSQRLFHDRVALAGGIERKHRDYDAHFDERDNDNDQWRLEAEAQPLRHWGATVGVTYLEGRLKARGDLASSPIRDTDISYDHHGLGVHIAAPWGRGRTRGRLEAEWMPEARTYTTPDKFDLNRFGRTNLRRQWDLTVTQRLWGQVDAVGNWSRLSSAASFAPGTAFDEQATDFEQSRFGLMLRAKWDLPKH